MLLARLRYRLRTRFQLTGCQTHAANVDKLTIPLTADVFQENMPSARIAIELGEQSLASGLLRGAEALAMDAIAAAPGWYKGYHLAGQVLDRQDNRRLGAACHAGALPDALCERYFPSHSLDMQPGCSQYNRMTLYGVERVRLPPPKEITESPFAQSDIDEVKARPAFVDRIVNGRAWHDAHNTVISDAKARVVDAHTCGSTHLVQYLRQRKKPVNLGERAFLIGARGCGNYYHWMLDVIPKLELCRQSGIDFTESDRFVIPFFRSRFQIESLSRFGIQESQLYFSHDASPDITARQLIVPFLRNNMGISLGKWVLETLQKIFLDENRVSCSGRKLFVSRRPGNSQGREIHNIHAVHQIFKRLGFDIVYPEQYSLSEQALLFREAALVAGPHGAGLANIAFCKPGVRIIEFYGQHLAPCYRSISGLLGLDYYRHYCPPSEPSQDDWRSKSEISTLAARRVAGFEIPTRDIEPLLSLAAV